MTTITGDPLSLLEALVACPSVTPEVAGAFEVVEAALAPLGFTVERLRFSGGGSYPVDNLFATRGSGGPHFLFAGHTDVVPPGDASRWRFPPFSPTRDDGRLYGRGTADMKSGVAAFIAALGRVPAGAGQISLAITNDEEADSVNGTDRIMDWAAERGHRFDFAIVGEPSSQVKVGDMIKIGRRGSVSGLITVTGKQGHVAYPHRANNPLPVLGAVVTALSAATIDEGNAHFPPTNLEFTSIDVGNPAGNVIPASGTARFNIRCNDQWTPESLEAWLRAQLAAVDTQGCTVDLTLTPPFARPFLTPQSPPLALLCDVIRRETGLVADLSTIGGTSDARFIAPHCPVVEFGLPGQTMHQVDENIAVDDLEELTRLYAAFLTEYLR